jgi:hypothetical protein
MRVKGYNNIQTATKRVVSLAKQKQSKKVKGIIKNNDISEEFTNYLMKSKKYIKYKLIYSHITRFKIISFIQLTKKSSHLFCCIINHA